MSLARAEKTARGVDAESEDLPANCVSNSSDERMICARLPGCADPGRICGGVAGICAFAQPKIVQHPEPARTKIRVGSVFLPLGDGASRQSLPPCSQILREALRAFHSQASAFMRHHRHARSVMALAVVISPDEHRWRRPVGPRPPMIANTCAWWRPSGAATSSRTTSSTRIPIRRSALGARRMRRCGHPPFLCPENPASGAGFGEA